MIGGSPLGGQEVVNIPIEVACERCRIVEGSRVDLRGPFDDGGMSALPLVVRRGQDGRFFALYGDDLARIHVHSPDGAFSGYLGRPGDGPGEFRFIGDIRFDEDGLLHAFDRRAGRHTVLDASDGSVLGTNRIPVGVWAGVPLADGAVVVSGSLQTREAVGYPLHVFDGSGTLRKSFGSDEPQFHPGMELATLVRWLLPAGPETFWAAWPNDYRIELWDVRGAMVRALHGNRDWFLPWTRQVLPRDNRPPSPSIVDIGYDAEGHLWVVMAVAGERWSEALNRDRRDSHGNPTLHQDERRHYYRDQIVEVIDPRSGQLLVRQRYPRSFGRFVDAGLVARAWTDAMGVPRVEVIPVRLEGLPTRDGPRLPRARARLAP
jgi:hypothetical protein